MEMEHDENAEVEGDKAEDSAALIQSESFWLSWSVGQERSGGDLLTSATS